MNRFKTRNLSVRYCWCLDKKPHSSSGLWFPKREEGGLGVRSLFKLKKYLLCQWNWCFTNKRDALWRDKIRRKSGEISRGWCSNVSRGSCRTGMWKISEKNGRPLYLMLVRGDRRVRFWKDSWCREEVLCLSFPSLIDLAVQKDVLVVDVWDRTREGGEWSPCSPKEECIPYLEDKFLLKSSKLEVSW